MDRWIIEEMTRHCSKKYVFQISSLFLLQRMDQCNNQNRKCHNFILSVNIKLLWILIHFDIIQFLVNWIKNSINLLPKSIRSKSISIIFIIPLSVFTWGRLSLNQSLHIICSNILSMLQLPPPPQIELVVDKPHLMGVLRRPLVRIRRKWHILEYYYYA